MRKFIIAALAAVALGFGAAPSFGQDDSRLAPIPCPSLEYDALRFDLKETIRENNLATYRYLASDGKLEARVQVRSFEGFPVREISARLANVSETEETAVVKNFKTFKQSYPFSADAPLTIDWLVGSICAPNDFTPQTQALRPGEEKILATPSGRPSSEVMPFVEASFDEQNGLLFAIGWTGDWQARFKHDGCAVSFDFGMERCAFKLKPGESVLQPSLLVFERKGQTRREFKTTVHRFMRERLAPRDKNGELVKPILAITAGGGNKTPKMMKDVLQYALDNKLPFDTYWVDAGWYGEPHESEPYSNCGTEWWKHVGNWKINVKTHPTGDLLPIADAVHDAGMRFLLWFEPERVGPEAPILTERPEFHRDGLLNYADPEVLKYIQSEIYGVIEKHGIDVYRQDFNMEPTGSWKSREADEGADRVGIVEAKHVEALYKFLDDMRAKFPDICQENCASGGRRIDFEMVKRAHSYCRSDYLIGQKPGDTAIILAQNATLNTVPYLPFQGGETNCAPVFDDYAFMSCVSSGTVFTPTDFDGGIVKRPFSADETAWFKKMFGWAKRLQAYYMGDFYQLTDETSEANDVWCAWACNRPEENDGFAIAFRRADAPAESQTFALPAIDKNARYEIETFDGEKTTVSGAELASWKVELPKRGFALVVYKKL
ncbi:MAG: alpha-galactosidase [Thermoguttaceae bacterium]|nr:alpha-galactosidase [Thermoguttaceae bacterium]